MPASGAFPPPRGIKVLLNSSLFHYNFHRASGPQRNPITLISSVHTLLIHTFNFPSTPSTLSNSTPSHQHLLAGLRQNRSNFCAMPTTLLLASLPPRTSVRRRASASEQITALLGSLARCPQLSEWLNPLFYISIDSISHASIRQDRKVLTQQSASRSNAVP